MSLTFRPHPLLRGGHAQTLAGTFLPGRKYPYRAVQRRIPLTDGDLLVMHDDQPASWKPGDRCVILLHGLAGCHQSPCMVRIAGKFNDAGVRTFRLDHRDCGAGEGLARQLYNAGRSDDVLVTLKEVIRLCPHSPISVVGFSLSANILLKMLGEDPAQMPPELVRAVAVNPPLDLAASVAALNRPIARIYDRHFVKLLSAQVARRTLRFPDECFKFPRPPKRMCEFDDWYTAPMSGYSSATSYYNRCSAAQFVPDIAVKTLILTSRDDPLVPVGPFEKLVIPPSVQLMIAAAGGHLGYLSSSNRDPDRRWMDWRVLEWVLQ